MSWSPSHLVVWPNSTSNALRRSPGSGEACDACRIILLNTSLLLYVLVVENETNGAWRPQDRQARSGTWRTQMPDRLGRSQPGADTDVITRAAAVPALAALAVIHVDLPGMPGPGPAGRVRVPRDRRGRDCGRRGDGSRASPAGPGGRQRARRRRDGRVCAAPGPARGLPRRPRRCRQLALPAGHRGAQRTRPGCQSPRPVNPRKLLAVLVDRTRQPSRS
jgi:hypothetical protein